MKIVLDEKDFTGIDKLKFDRRRFQQVLVNLLSNAVKHQSKGFITIKVRILTTIIQMNEHFLEVTVTD